MANLISSLQPWTKMADIYSGVGNKVDVINDPLVAIATQRNPILDSTLALGHELIHAYHYLYGCAYENKHKQDIQFNRHNGKESFEEITTTGGDDFIRLISNPLNQDTLKNIENMIINNRTTLKTFNQYPYYKINPYNNLYNEKTLAANFRIDDRKSYWDVEYKRYQHPIKNKPKSISAYYKIHNAEEVKRRNKTEPQYPLDNNLRSFLQQNSFPNQTCQ